MVRGLQLCVLGIARLGKMEQVTYMCFHACRGIALAFCCVLFRMTQKMLLLYTSTLRFHRHHCEEFIFLHAP